MNILFSNYHFENDETGKDRYDYAREFIFEEKGEENVFHKQTPKKAIATKPTKTVSATESNFTAFSRPRKGALNFS